MTVIDRKRHTIGNKNRSTKLIAYWKEIRAIMKRYECSGDEARCFYRRTDR